MGDSGGGGNRPTEYVLPTYKPLPQKSSQGWGMMGAQDNTAQVEAQRRKAATIYFAPGTDAAAVDALYKADPGNQVFKQAGRGGIQTLTAEQTYLYGKGKGSKVEVDAAEVAQGLASNKRNKKNAAPLASGTQTGGVGNGQGRAQGASQPGSILGGTTMEAVKSLLGL